MEESSWQVQETAKRPCGRREPGQRHGYLASKTSGGQGGDVNFDTVGQGALEG